MSTIKGLHAELVKDRFFSAMKKKGYATFDNNKKYNLNIIGVRKGSHSAEKFDDLMVVIYKNKDLEWEVRSYELTTDPGPSILRKPINKKGTAILVPDQYRSTWKIGPHGKTRYTALIQRLGKVKVFRDNDKDRNLEMDESNIDEGYFGINIHKHSSSYEREFVRGASAGCQVFKITSDFNEFLELCQKSASLFNNSFTYTLLEEEDLQL
jgi:hypothetical protein